MTRSKADSEHLAARMTDGDISMDGQRKQQLQPQRTSTEQAVHEVSQIDINSLADNSINQSCNPTEFEQRQRQDPEITDLWGLKPNRVEGIWLLLMAYCTGEYLLMLAGSTNSL